MCPEVRLEVRGLSVDLGASGVMALVRFVPQARAANNRRRGGGGFWLLLTRPFNCSLAICGASHFADVVAVALGLVGRDGDWLDGGRGGRVHGHGLLLDPVEVGEDARDHEEAVAVWLGRGHGDGHHRDGRGRGGNQDGFGNLYSRWWLLPLWQRLPGQEIAKFVTSTIAAMLLFACACKVQRRCRG